MDLRDTPDEARFRGELREWLEANLPAAAADTAIEREPASMEALREWSSALYEAGYSGLTWPTEYGGGGAPYSYQAIFLEEMARAEAPQHLGVIGLGMAGPTIIAHGTDAQKARLPPAHPLGGRDLVPGLLGARRRIRPLGGANDRAARRRSLRRRRPEGVVVVRAHRRLVPAHRAERPGIRAATRGSPT